MYQKIVITPRYCPHCGSYVREDDVFCSKCGIKIEKEELTDENVLLFVCCNYNYEPTSEGQSDEKAQTFTAQHLSKDQKRINAVPFSRESFINFIEEYKDSYNLYNLPNGDLLCFNKKYPVSKVEFTAEEQRSDYSMSVTFDFYFDNLNSLKNFYERYEIKINSLNNPLELSNEERLKTFCGLIYISLKDFSLLPKTKGYVKLAFYPYVIVEALKTTMEEFKKSYPDEWATLELANELKE